MKLELQKQQIRKLNKKSYNIIVEEIGTDTPEKYLANPDFFTGEFYHNTETQEDKNSLLLNGIKSFNPSKNPSYSLGRGLYVGRDKEVLASFYTYDLENPERNLIGIKGNFRFYDIVGEDKDEHFSLKFKKKSKNEIKKWVLNRGYDGIRYYDPFCTGEEFVLFSLKGITDFYSVE